ncbi:hypothetical protein IGI04_035901, partial [Brassica rapa subsp. trilocularis]
MVLIFHQFKVFSDLEDFWDDLHVSRLKYNALDDFQEVFQKTSRKSYRRLRRLDFLEVIWTSWKFLIRWYSSLISCIFALFNPFIHEHFHHIDYDLAMSRLHFSFIVIIRCWSVQWSDLRCLGALSLPARATTSSHSQPERPARATSSSHSRFDGSRHKETRRERPPGASDYARSLRVFCLEACYFRGLLVEGLEGQEELCFINNNGNWYKKEPNFQYNNYQQKSYPNNQQSGYPPRNNQQGSYQPQQNPSSGSSASQESSTDTLLKQILESQTRSEKHVGYELKNLHSKIDGSYNELNNKFSHLASTPERPARATSQSDYLKSLPARATSSSHSQIDGSRHKETRRERPPGATMLGHSA